MSALLADIRKQTNGAVSYSMREKGIEWPLNYGVSIPAIKAAAESCATDHEFGKLLYQQEIRELRLAGTMIADPHSVTQKEAPFWAAGIINVEVAEHISFLLARSPWLSEISFLWLTSDNPLTSYAALLSLSRRIVAERNATWLDVAKLNDKLKEFRSLTNLSIWRSAATLLNNLYRFSPLNRMEIRQSIYELVESLEPIVADYFKEDLFLDPDE